MFKRVRIAGGLLALTIAAGAGVGIDHPFVAASASGDRFQASQRSASGPPARDAVLSAARTIIGKARYASLITLDEKGQPQARIVDPFEPEADFTIWVGTNPSTRKVAQIQADPRVTMIYFDPPTAGYVTLLGRARVIRDQKEKAAHWKDAWTPIYKDKNRGDDYVLIRVEPTRLEVVSVALGMVNDPATWRPVSIDLR